MFELLMNKRDEWVGLFNNLAITDKYICSVMLIMIVRDYFI